MRALKRRICLLQRRYSKSNTPLMRRRGQLVRQALPTSLDVFRSHFAGILKVTAEDIVIEGRDGTGLKSEIPWVRVAANSRSPSAHEGWYCVYLFRKQGDGVYLTLMHASTRWENHSPRPRPRAEVAELVLWARGVLDDHDLELSTEIDISTKATGLAGAYERSVCLSKFYAVDDLPSDEKLVLDIDAFLKMLGALYEETRLGRSPDAPQLQAEVAQQNAELPIVATALRGQGYGLTAQERREVELHAMAMARSHLISAGFLDVNDTSANSPYDFTATLNGDKHIIEVKGTTGPANTLILTRNEVLHHRAAFPHNCLIVVSEISLSSTEQILAHGGKISCLVGWQIDDAALTPLAFQYRFP